MKLYYKDFITRKRRYTQGRPLFAIYGGLLGCWYLQCNTKSTVILIPEYLLESEGREILNVLKEGG